MRRRSLRRLALVLLLLSLLGGCSLARSQAPATPEPSPAPTRTRRPTTTRAPSSTPAPSATPAPPALLVDGAARPVLALGPSDPTRHYVTLVRHTEAISSAVELVPLSPNQPAPDPFEGAAAGWSSDGRLLAYVRPAQAGIRPGRVFAFDPQLGVSLPLLGADELALAGAWIPTRGRLVFLADHDGRLSLRLWGQSAVTPLVELGPASPAGGAALAVSPVGSLLALPIITEREGLARGELLIVDLTQGMTVTLTTAPADHPLSFTWSPNGELAFSAGGPISVYTAASGRVALLGADGRPQDWGAAGLLVVSPDGELLLVPPGQPPRPIVRGRRTIAQEARWLRHDEILLLRDGSVYRLAVPE